MRILNGIIRVFHRLLESIMVICLAIMFFLVLANVLLRFIFNSGIEISEELPRFLFVWIIFIGATVAIKDKSHISVDMFIAKMPRLGKSICYFLCQILMCLCSLALFWGTWLESDILATTYSPVLNMNMLLVFGVSYLTGGCIFITSILNIFRFFFTDKDELFSTIENKDN